MSYLSSSPWQQEQIQFLRNARAILSVVSQLCLSICFLLFVMMSTIIHHMQLSILHLTTAPQYRNPPTIITARTGPLVPSKILNSGQCKVKGISRTQAELKWNSADARTHGSGQSKVKCISGTQAEPSRTQAELSGTHVSEQSKIKCFSGTQQNPC